MGKHLLTVDKIKCEVGKHLLTVDKMMYEVGKHLLTVNKMKWGETSVNCGQNDVWSG